MWDLPGPGFEAMFLALAGGFLTTAPPGKSREWDILKITVPNYLLLIFRNTVLKYAF